MKVSHALFGSLALLSALLVAVPLIVGMVYAVDEGTLETILVGSPTLLVPAMLALRPPGRWRTRLDPATRGAILLGGISFALLLSLMRLVQVGGGDGSDLPPRWIAGMVLVTALVGVGVAGRSWIVARARGVPWALAGIGLLTGTSYAMLVGGAALEPLGWGSPGELAGPRFWKLLAPLWVVTHVLFGVWLGARFLAGRHA